MGVFVKRNRWFIDYYLPDGRRKREVVGHVGKITRTLAEKALKARVGEIVQGKFNLEATKKPIPMYSLFDRFLEWAKTNYKHPRKTASIVNPLRSFFGDHLISEMNLWLVDKYKAHRKSEGKKPETVNRELGVLRRILNLAIEWKLITATPVKGLTLIKVPKYTPRVLCSEEFEKLYLSASAHFKPVLLCAYLTGMRKGEIAKLKWEDVSLKDGYLIVKESKNGESRTIPLHSRLISTLMELKDKSENPYVFTTQEGEAYTSESAWKRAFYTPLKKSGIGKCRFHDLRHTFCSNLIVGEKEDFVTVMELTGHKDMRMLKRYSHTRESAKRSAIDKLGNGLNLTVIDTPLDTTLKTITPTVANLSVVSVGK